ncbi:MULTISPECIES: hypothetical protein [Mameliella]|uniref:hypothetical protein n=1 Tax=Mameliella TaxID=1434019 RepID=UPI000B531364|nr:hypothetical protein [Mameliella alba]MCR9274101.1 hypothetical protein [Paracoccaceae bacterium]OWV59058.1 hypothetical protein CDZ98_12135 [Mameliella alba]
MIRREAAEALRQWQEALIGLATMALGAYWGFFTGGGLLHWIGYLVILLGVALTVTGVQRGRFRRGGGGPGVVQVVERRVSYFGPLSGGIVDLDALEALSLDPTSEPPVWLLMAPGQPRLEIPLTAKGADQLFDAFATLPGIRTEHMLRQMQEGAAHQVVIWRAASVRDAARRLH